MVHWYHWSSADAGAALQITVVLSNMFHPSDAIPAAEIEADVLSQCKQLGAIDKVKVHAHNPEGVVQVRFRTHEAAQECVALMNNRFYAQRLVRAHLWGMIPLPLVTLLLRVQGSSLPEL